MGASTAEAQESVGVEIAEAVAEVLQGGRIRNAINMPSIDPKDLESLALILIFAIGWVHLPDRLPKDRLNRSKFLILAGSLILIVYR